MTITQSESDLLDVRAEIAAVLGVEANSLPADGDLVMHGLDSLRMMKLAGQWRKRGYDVDFARLVADPTVEAWTELLGDDAVPVEDDVVVVVDSSGTSTPVESDGSGDAPIDGERFPLAPMQHAYWVGRSDSHALGGVAAHLYLEFDGDALASDDAAAEFTAAVTALADRHPMLRARVHADGTQSIGPMHPGSCAVHDLRAAPADEAETELERRRDEGSHRMLPVDEGGMFRAELTLLPGGRSRIHLDVDMLAADAMSFRVLTDDLARLYLGEELAPLRSTYAELGTARQAGPVLESDLAWWRERIPGMPGAPELPTVDSVAAAATGGAGPARNVRLNHRIDAADRARLEAHAREHGVTPAAAVAAAFAEAVGTHAASPRFLLTVPMFDRDSADPHGDHPDLERVVGDFTTSLLIAVDLGRPATLAARAAQLRGEMRDAAVHGTVGGLDVLRELSRFHGEPVVSPIVFTSALGLGELFSPTVTEQFGEPSWIVSQGPQVLLDAQITEVAGGLLLNWDVRVSELQPGVAEAMFGYYVRVLDQLIAGDWDRPAPSPVDEQTLATRRETEAPLPSTDVFDVTLHGQFLAAAAGRADAPAVITDVRTWTHSELAAEARAIAGALLDVGVRAGDTVVVNLPGGGAQVAAAIGVLIAGAAYVPVAPTQPEARRERIATVAEPAAVLTDRPDDWSGSRAPVLDIDDATAHHPVPADRPRVSGEHLAYVLFTSGSTGLPKGVEVPHRAAVATLTDLVARLGLGAGDRTLMVSSLEFDLSVFDIFAPLAVGGAVVVPTENDDDDDTGTPSTPGARVDDWVRLLDQHQVTHLNCVPSILGMLLDLGPLAPSVREVIMGGDKVESSLIERVREHSPHCRVAGLGGATETAIHSTYCGPDDVPAGAAFVPYGHPLAGVRCRVVDERANDRPDLVPGELWIGGAGVASGYRGDPERTAERFVEHDGERWYRTGDVLRYLPGGFLDFLGRADHMVKVRGYRVELGEVEAALLRAPGVTGAVAWSDGRDLRAAVAATGDAAPAMTGEDLRAGLAGDLPPHMIPRSISVLDELPLTGNGKYDRAKVQVLTAPEAREAGTAPRTPLEEVVAGILAGVLGLEAVGVHDDFLDLGGDSLQATRFVAELRDWLEVLELTVADVFARRTVAELAERIAGLAGIDDAVAEYLEVNAMSDDEVAAALARPGSAGAGAGSAAGSAVADAAGDAVGELPLVDRLTAEPMDPDAHAPVIHPWLTHPKSVFWEMLEASLEDVKTLIRDAQTGSPYGMRLGYFDGVPQFLFELYDPAQSELADPATGYVAAEGDIGMHLLVAPSDVRTPGFTAAVMLHIMRTAFTIAGVRRVVVEPDVRNVHVHQLNAAVGFTVAGDYPVGTKTARLSYCLREDFMRLTEGGRRPAEVAGVADAAELTDAAARVENVEA